MRTLRAMRFPITSLAVALVACTRSTPAPQTPPSPTPSPTPAPVVAAPSIAPADPCEPLLVAHRAAVARLGDAEGNRRELLASFGRCLPTRGGQWAVVVDDVRSIDATDTSPVHLEGHWSVAHAAGGGDPVRSRREASWFDQSRPALEGAWAFDYDGDGEEELVLHTVTHGTEQADTAHGEVLTFRDGAVGPYRRADGVEPEEARDVDGDGRPDLLTRAPYRGEGDDSPSDFTYSMAGPALLAHSLADGGFSRDDAAARAHARTACPARLAAVFPTGNEIGGSHVVCARVWGVPAADVVRAIRARCASVQEAGSGNPRRPHCGDVRVLERWAALTPPVTLP